jgi:hypothetical protein
MYSVPPVCGEEPLGDVVPGAEVDEQAATPATVMTAPRAATVARHLLRERIIRFLFPSANFRVKLTQANATLVMILQIATASAATGAPGYEQGRTVAAFTRQQRMSRPKCSHAEHSFVP